MRMNANTRSLQYDTAVAHERYLDALTKFQGAMKQDVLYQENLWRRGADCNIELLREKGIAPPKEEETNGS